MSHLNSNNADGQILPSYMKSQSEKKGLPSGAPATGGQQVPGITPQLNSTKFAAIEMLN